MALMANFAVSAQSTAIDIHSLVLGGGTTIGALVGASIGIAIGAWAGRNHGLAGVFGVVAGCGLGFVAGGFGGYHATDKYILQGLETKLETLQTSMADTAQVVTAADGLQYRLVAAGRNLS